jgi:DNA-binding response OmpR family regulator
MLKSALVVEDELLIAMLLQDMLEDLGYEDVIIASDIAGACEALGKTKPDIALLDLNLAGTSSAPFARKLQAANVPIILSSGYDTDSLDEDLRRYPLLTKPYGAEELRSRIEQALAMEKL